jgi:putative heme iron utilization protein
MSVDRPTPVSMASPEEPDRAARRLVRTALTGALATLDQHHSGHPYASLVLIATEPDGTPLTLISQLARHTRNLQKDARASLLIDGTAGLGDPMAGGRLTLTGQARPTKSPTALRRFLARHSYARAYANLPDFLPYAFEVAGAHYIGGFGRIVELPATVLQTAVAQAAELVAAEPDIVAHMNADHADAVELCATEIANRPPGAWRMCAIDPDGVDLLHRNSAARLEFASPVRTPEEARSALIELVRQARSRREATT